MLLTPKDQPFNWKQPPRLTLGLCLVISLLFLFWHPADREREQALQQQYERTLQPVEWPLYETHLLKANQRRTLTHLKAAKEAGNTRELARYLGADAGFVESTRLLGADYMDEATLAEWRYNRDNFDQEHQKLSYEAVGVKPGHFRPITFLTFNLVQSSTVELLGVLLFLLSAGVALELALGSGAVLTAFLGGGVAGATVYLIVNGGGVLPLAGAGAGIGGVMGFFLMQFRSQPLRYVGKIDLSALVLLPLWLAFLAAQFLLAEARPAVLAAQLAGFVSGPLWQLAYRHWFTPAHKPVEVAPETSAAEVEHLYREQLQQALNAVARMDFAEAQKRLRELVKAYPQDVRVLTQLYQIEKLDPASPTFDAVARRLFLLCTLREDGAHAALPVYREYDNLSVAKKALDTEVCLKLAMRFARAGAVKEAEKLMKTVLERKVPHPLLQKTALALAQAFEKLHDPGRGEYYRSLATPSRAH